MTILSRKRILQTKITCKTSRICPRQRQWATLRVVQKSTVPAQYRFSADDLEYRPSQCCHWSSIGNQSMQMRIFLALLRGGVEVIKDE